MTTPNPATTWQFFRNHRYRLLMVGLLFIYSCNLVDDEVLTSRQAFVGNFQVKQKERNSTFEENYSLNIRASNKSNEVLLTNLRPFQDQVIATVVGNSLNIPSQSIRVSGTQSVTVSGSGTLDNGSTLEISFSYNFGSPFRYTVTGFKL